MGGAGSDGIVSGAGDDILIGGPGNDRLYSQTGNNILEGGTGKDRFIFFAEELITYDTITDFTIGEDLIDLRKFDEITSIDDIDHFYFSETDRDNSYLDLTEYDGGYIILDGIDFLLETESFLFAEPEVMVA